MSILLSYGAAADLPDMNGLTPLHISILESHTEGINLLVKDWHAESNVSDYDMHSQNDDSCNAGNVLAQSSANQKVSTAPDACSGKIDEALDTCWSENVMLICHVCMVQTSQSASNGWLECSIQSCCDFYALCKSCVNILKANDPPPTSTLLKILGKTEHEIVSQSPRMPIVDSSKLGISFDKKVRKCCAFDGKVTDVAGSSIGISSSLQVSAF
jgi:hypothetical protein